MLRDRYIEMLPLKIRYCFDEEHGIKNCWDMHKVLLLCRIGSGMEKSSVTKSSVLFWMQSYVHSPQFSGGLFIYHGLKGSEYGTIH